MQQQSPYPQKLVKSKSAMYKALLFSGCLILMCFIEHKVNTTTGLNILLETKCQVSMYYKCTGI